MLNCYRGTICAPKATDRKRVVAAAVMEENEKAHGVAMEMTAKEKRFLDLVVCIQCPNSFEVQASALMDTVAKCAPGLAEILKKTSSFWGLQAATMSRRAAVTGTYRWARIEVPVSVRAGAPAEPCQI